MEIEQAVDGGDSGGQFFLLFFEQTQGDRIGVMGFQQLALFALQLVFFTPELLPLGGELVGGFLDLRLEPCLQLRPELRGEGDFMVQGLHLPLDFLDQDGSLLAVVALPVTPGAGVVGVADAGTGFCVLNEQPLAAGTAVDRALEEMRVIPDALAVLMARKRVLHFLPGLLVHQRFMLPGQIRPLETNFAGVVRVVENGIQDTLVYGF